MLRPVKPLGGFSAYSPAHFLKQAAFCLFQKMGSRRQASNRLLQLTFSTPKPLFLLSLKTVAKLTLCATSGKKISGGLEVYIVLSTVLRLKSAGSLSNASAGFLTLDKIVQNV